MTFLSFNLLRDPKFSPMFRPLFLDSLTTNPPTGLSLGLNGGTLPDFFFIQLNQRLSCGVPDAQGFFSEGRRNILAAEFGGSGCSRGSSLAMTVVVAIFFLDPESFGTPPFHFTRYKFSPFSSFNRYCGRSSFFEEFL